MFYSGTSAQAVVSETLTVLHSVCMYVRQSVFFVCVLIVMIHK